MALMANLKLTTALKPSHTSAVQVRRNKMCHRLVEQIQLATAQQSGARYNATKLRSVVDQATGMRKQVELPKRVKPWWFTADNGKVALNVRYGARLLEIAKGKFAVELANEKDLIPTLEVIKRAVQEGELDAAIASVSVKLRDGFKK